VPDDEGGKHRHSFKDDWDPRAIIALVVIIGAFALALASIITDTNGATVPAWVVALIGAITFYYYRNGKGD
jgi:ABC-type Fe3+-siderophore transport system permease subunit